MIITTFLFLYSLFTTGLLIFLCKILLQYRNWYFQLLSNPKGEFYVMRFFSELKPLLNRIYTDLKKLQNKKGRKPTDYCFQFRFLLWWKFFGSSVLQQAIRDFNRSEFLKKFLGCPVKKYTREIFHYFRKKLSSESLEDWGTVLVQEFYEKKQLSIKIVVMDSFPVKSFLNTAKCLKVPNIDFTVLKLFLATIDLDKIVRSISSSPKMFNKIKTKLLTLLVKEVWDLQTWNRCWKELTGSNAKKYDISLPYNYKALNSLRSIEEVVYSSDQAQSIEKKLVTAVVTTLKTMKKLPDNFHPKRLKDLNATWHKPHRWRDQGISQYYCASKNEYGFGRGGIVMVDEETEIPILLGLTTKYKQGTDSINNFIDHIKGTFNDQLQGCVVLADSEFGVEDVIENIKTKITTDIKITSYGNSSTQIKLTKEERTKRKTVERVIARLERNWSLEHPRHLGLDYSKFHLQLARFCDLVQVYFNDKIKNHTHLHAILPIRG